MKRGYVITCEKGEEMQGLKGETEWIKYRLKILGIIEKGYTNKEIAKDASNDISI